MATISKVTGCEFTKIQIGNIVDVTLKCSRCTFKFSLHRNLSQMGVVATVVVHRVQGNVEWVEAVTNALPCPNCSEVAALKIGVHRTGGTIVCKPDYELHSEWWDHSDLGG